MIDRGAAMPVVDQVLAAFPRAVALVNLDAVAANVRALLRELGPACRLMVVVKANAYGHGATPVAIAALRAGASALAVACVDEGVQLRQAGLVAPILVLGATPAEEMSRVVAYQLTPTVCDVDAARALQAATPSHGRSPVHIKVDCGLHRFGIDAAEAVAFVTWVAQQPRLVVDGLYTHFSSAEEADGAATAREYERFTAVVTALRERGVRPHLHAANSAATMGVAGARLDQVRVGLALYGLAGIYPGASRLTQWPALELHARIGRVHTLGSGEAVGYGRTYVATRARQVALVSIGYGDGFTRLLGNRGAVIVGGQRAPVVGRVSMDQIVADVTDIGGVGAGMPATIIGRQGDEAITAADLAALTETIPYEIVTGLAPRVPRAYLQRGRLVGVTDLLGSRQLSTAPDDAIFRWPSSAVDASLASGS
jgi:alanine racemase